MLAAGLLAGCSGSEDDDTPEADSQEIRLDASVWKVVEGTRAKAPARSLTRATTFDNDAALKEEAHFTCVAYNANTTTAYIPTTTVDWNSTSSAWEFNNGSSHYYWPLPATEGGACPSLDFFGYMPTTTPSYITTGPTYTAAHNVTFACSNLPMTHASQSGIKEFVFGMAVDQNKENASAGVPLTFQHPFARIKLQLAASHPDVTINSIAFKSIKNNGSYSKDDSPQWTSSGDATDFTLTLTGDARIFNNNPASTRQIGDYYLMIPQEWTGVIEVDADCVSWGETKNYPSLTTTVPTTWQPGYSYTYTFNISPDDLRVNIERFTEQW